MNAKRKTYLTWMLMTMAVLILAPLPVASQDHGSGGGGGCGDLFGDLIHILRDDKTGQPILAQRWIELPAELQGYGWGYCPIAVYGEDKQELSFLPYSCDIDPALIDLVEKVDYFGRLNGGRTKERNNRMHFNEVISNIKLADVVTQAPDGRLKLGFDCTDLGKTPCAEWATIDSPMESQGLYSRTMRYGHLATDPYEIDAWSHGDPKLSTQFYPALDLEDWDKFDKSMTNLMPEDGKDLEECYDYDAAEWFDDVDGDGVWDPAEPFYDIDKDGEYDAVGPPPEPFTDLNENLVWDAAEPFSDDNDNGVADEFVFRCADPEYLEHEDFISAAIMLAAAAPKTGKVTNDLIQYFNRFVKITKTTDLSKATLRTLPALYRDCWEGADPADPPEEGEVVEPPYLPVEECEIVDADSLLTPNYSLFPDMQELFVDFKGLESYRRSNEKAAVIIDNTPNTWTLNKSEPLLDWVKIVNGTSYEVDKINGFRDATNDYLRQIEFIHNYDPPEDLYCTYVPSLCLQ